MNQSPVRLRSWLLLALVLVPVALAAAVSQPPGGNRRPPEEEEGDKKPGKRPPEEEEDHKPRRTIRVDDPEEAPGKAGRPALDVDLTTAARRVKHEGVKQLFRDLATPHDLVVVKGLNADRFERVRPLAEYIGDDPSTLSGDVRLDALDQNFHDTKSYPLPPTGFKRVDHYELLAQKRVDRFLNEPFDRLGEGDPRYLSEVDKLLAAEHALTAVARYHESARTRGTRQGDGWNLLRDTLRARLLKVILARMQLSIDRGDWDETMALARQTAERFPAPPDREKIAQPVARMIEKALQTPDRVRTQETLRRLREFEEMFPGSEAARPIRQELTKRAQPFLELAAQRKKDGKMTEARDALRQAEEIYPYLAGLRDLQLDVEQAYPILRVGVRHLPVYLSPALAFTDGERQAVELLFEGLVELALEGDSGRYRPALSHRWPVLVPLGRQFHLPRNAYWSDDKPLTANDVQATVRMLRSESWPGRTHAWADDLIEGAAVSDPFRVRLSFRQGYLDPLSLLAFKVLPAQQLARPDEERFGKAPVGSGPYRLVPGSHSEKGRPFVRLLANQHYRNRPGKDGLPRIREIQLFESPDPVADFRDRRIDLALDLTAAQAAALRKAGNVTVPGALRGRRIYFLAVNHNHRVKPALQSPEFRRALAFAVPREKLLEDHFRGKLGKDVHRALNGPYPPGSWACNPDLKADFLNDLDLARAQMLESKKSDVRLTLKYPSGDDEAEKALEALARHWKEHLDVEIELKKLEPHRLRQDVEGEHDYDLAYYHYDYPDLTYWLWPLFDPRSTGNGGRNYLGFLPAPDLEQRFRDAMSHRDFRRVEEITHYLHRRLVQIEMPFIPLWQLDRHIAVHDHLKLYDGDRPLDLDAHSSPPLDPLRLFRTAESWRLRRKPG